MSHGYKGIEGEFRMWLGLDETSTVAPSGQLSTGAQSAAHSDLADLIRSIPPTRYYGSKRKLLPWLGRAFAGLQFQTALDLFGGTSAVSQLLQAMGKSVTYHDGLAFNSDVARTLLALKIPVSREDVCAFIASVDPTSGLISQTYRGKFFTDGENQWLDGFCHKLASEVVDKHVRSLLLYLLYQACLKKRPYNLFHRANLSMRTNTSVHRTFGNLATWNKDFDQHMLACFDELNLRKGLIPAIILEPGDAAKVEEGYDLVYLDPPYISEKASSNADNYWRKYHFLEGLARYSEWGRLVDEASPIGAMRTPDWLRHWSNKATFPALLEELIRAHRQSIVVLSYVDHAIPPKYEIRKIFEDNFASVEIQETSHHHALGKLPRNELLILGMP